MSSILTNTSAMVALQTLKSINKGLAQTQGEISTGMRVANAKDNAATWAISSVMRSDVAGFEAITESLALGDATVAVARDGSETLVDLLQEMKGRIIAAQEDNVDRVKIQADVKELANQIKATVDASQFNGLNLLQRGDDVSFLSSLNRTGANAVDTSTITATRKDMTDNAGVVLTGGDAIAGAIAGDDNLLFTKGQQSFTALGAAAAGDFAADFTVTFTVGSGATERAITVNVDGLAGSPDADAIGNLLRSTFSANAELTEAGLTFTGADAEIVIGSDFENAEITSSSNAILDAITMTGVTARAETTTFAARAVSAGDGYRMTIGGVNYDYVARAGDTNNDVVNGLAAEINARSETNNLKVNVVESTNPTALSASLQIATRDTAAINAGTATVVGIAAHADSQETGGMREAALFDVSTKAGATRALGQIEGLIQRATESAASFGSTQKRIDVQSAFTGRLIDSLKTGIGSLVDADMEAASARLQALQVQQQLGVQALSIANQSPQSILALFR